MEATPKERYLYIDYLRLLVIILVIMIHLACTYSGIGSWYYYEDGSVGILSIILFGVFQSFTQAYFMGFMFLLSGFFIPASYKRRGIGKFIKDRAIRLGIPALLYMLIIHPVIVYIILGDYYQVDRTMFLKNYLQRFLMLNFLSDSGPLWFAVALLIFSIIYSLIKYFSKDTDKNSKKALPSFKSICFFIGVMGSITFAIRIFQPIGTDILNMQLCFFTQYILFFMIGIKAYEQDWFKQIHFSWGMNWLKAALIGGPLLLFGLFIGTGAASRGIDAFDSAMGGLHLASFIYSLWESFIAVSMSIGLIALFKEKLNRPIKGLQYLSHNGFAVYVFHPPIIIYLSYILRNWTLPPFIKFLVLLMSSLPICFLISHFILFKIPLLKKVL
ncbi:MAG: hypothetical protein K0R69_2727 [Clostridia bacterium]|jgi:surface polysaccharide O-acyltransferase-like enzyme|nr:hypothetical protein [Clostridia bacterium]